MLRLRCTSFSTLRFPALSQQSLFRTFFIVNDSVPVWSCRRYNEKHPCFARVIVKRDESLNDDRYNYDTSIYPYNQCQHKSFTYLWHIRINISCLAREYFRWFVTQNDMKPRKKNDFIFNPSTLCIESNRIEPDRIESDRIVINGNLTFCDITKNVLLPRIVYFDWISIFRLIVDYYHSMAMYFLFACIHFISTSLLVHGQALKNDKNTLAHKLFIFELNTR